MEKKTLWIWQNWDKKISSTQCRNRHFKLNAEQCFMVLASVLYILYEKGSVVTKFEINAVS